MGDMGDEFGLFCDDGSDSDSSSSSCEFARCIESQLRKAQFMPIVDDDDDDDEEWVDAEEVDSYTRLCEERVLGEAKRKQREYESSTVYPFDMFVQARYEKKDKVVAAQFFQQMVGKRMHTAWLSDHLTENLMDKNIVVAGKLNNRAVAKRLVNRIMLFDDLHRGVLCTYHPAVKIDEHGFVPEGGRRVMLGGVIGIDDYNAAVRLTNKTLVAYDYERFVQRAKNIVPEITKHAFPDHCGLWDSFFGWCEVLYGGSRVTTLDDTFYAQLHIANTMRNINRSIIDTYYGGDAGVYSDLHKVTVVKLRRESLWMINDYGTHGEIEVLHRIERYVAIDPVAAVPDAFDIVNWENMYWYNKYPLEAIIAFNVVEPYKYMIKQVLATIDDKDRTFFFRKHLEGPDLPEQYTVPIIPKEYIIEDIAGAWVWDVIDRGGVERYAWQIYCMDTAHPCIKIVFEERTDTWVIVDFVVPRSIGFDAIRTFKSGKLKGQTKEQVNNNRDLTC